MLSKTTIKKIGFDESDLKQIYGNAPITQECNYRRCDEIIVLSDKDLNFKKMVEDMGFVYRKYCPKHIAKMYERSLRDLQK